MSCNIEEQIWVLGGWILGAMGSRVAHDHEHRLIRFPLFWLAEEGQRVVGDQVGEVVLGIVEAVFNLKQRQDWLRPYFCPPASEASREVENFDWKKNPHAPVYGLIKKQPRLAPFAGGYKICQTNFTST